MSRFLAIFLLSMSYLGCNNTVGEEETEQPNDTLFSEPIPVIEEPAPPLSLPDLFKDNPAYIADGFDFPVGKPDAKRYYNANRFGNRNHSGDDWNGIGGGNTDLGDPIYVIGNGYVLMAEDIWGGWGNVIRVIHQLPDGKLYESLYAHCDTVLVEPGDWVNRGQTIGTIGTAHDIYPAHLHFEVREEMDMLVGDGYSADEDGYLDPTKFVERHRKVGE